MAIDFPYNKGAITRPTFEDGNYGRVHNFVWRLRQVLSPDSVLLLGWADAQIEKTEGGTWVPRVDDIQNTFGWDDKQWRRVRKELENIGCVKSEHTKDLKSEKSVHTLNIDLTGLPALAAELPVRNGGSRARPAKNAGSRKPPEMRGSREPPEVTGLTTTSELRLNNHDQPKSGGAEDCTQVRSALAPSGATGAAGLGTRLVGLLTPAERRRADTVSRSASVDQLDAAEAAVRASMANGSVRSIAALAVALGKAAVRGEVGGGVSTPALAADPWPAREARPGLSVMHPLGLLVAEPGARAWRHRGGERAGQLVSGKDALKVWERVEAGELAIQPVPA